jgi:hypothetical protein
MTAPFLINQKWAEAEARSPDAMPTKARSYTRFVLPFAYRLETVSPPAAGKPRYTRAGEADWVMASLPGRKRYLTEETSDVLFNRTHWFVARDVHPTAAGWEFDFFPNRGLSESDPWAPRQEPADRRVRLRLQPPAVVLFECPPEAAARSDTPTVDELETGFLVLQIEFGDPPDRESSPAYQAATLHDLLRFNTLFRYWLKPFAGHESKMQALSGFLDLLPDQATSTQGTSAPDAEDRLYLDRWESWLRLPVKIATGYATLVPASWRTRTRQWFKTGDEARAPGAGPESRQQRGWAIYADDRAFVWTCALLPRDECSQLEACGEVSVETMPPDTGPPKRELRRVWDESNDRPVPSAYWVKLLNVDDAPAGSLSRQPATGFERKWVEERTYWRWAASGSWYGFNYHAAAMLATPMDEPPTWRHWQEVYFDQTLLLLYIRVTLFRFSVWINRISDVARRQARMPGRQAMEELAEPFAAMRSHFALFTNLYQFPLLSNQQQGLEMYQLAREALDAQELYEEIQGEIQETEEVLAAQADEQRNRLMDRLNVVATVGLGISLVLGVLAMDRLFEADSPAATPVVASASPQGGTSAAPAANLPGVPAASGVSTPATPTTSAPGSGSMPSSWERLRMLCRTSVAELWPVLGLVVFWVCCMALLIGFSQEIGRGIGRIARWRSRLPQKLLLASAAVLVIFSVIWWLAL